MQRTVSKTTFNLDTLIADALSVVDAGNVILKSDNLGSKLSLDITNTQLKTLI
jgi:hypothetical protein